MVVVFVVLMRVQPPLNGVNGDERVAHAFRVGEDVIDSPGCGVDRRQHMDRHCAAARRIASAGIDGPRDVEIHRHDRHAQVRGHVERTLVEVTDFTGGDAGTSGLR